MNNPEISIIMPVYNVEEEIYPTLKSILDQTYESIEVIIIDDGSVDNTNPILERYLKLDSRIKLLETDAEGEAYAQNLGLKQARGKYVMFLKTGTLISSNLIEYLLQILDTHQCGILAYDYFTITEKEFHNYDPIPAPQQQAENLTSLDSNQYFENLSSENIHDFVHTCVLWNKLINKSILSNFEFDITKNIPIPFALQKLLTSHIPIIISNQKLIAVTQTDKYLKQISFSYDELDKIDFLQNLLIYFKKVGNTTAMKNISIRLLDLLYKIRIKLNNIRLDIYDLDEQKKAINNKFSSIRKFLITRYPENKEEYTEYFDKYKQILDTENFVNNHPELYPKISTTKDITDTETKTETDIEMDVEMDVENEQLKTDELI